MLNIYVNIDTVRIVCVKSEIAGEVTTSFDLKSLERDDDEETGKSPYLLIILFEYQKYWEPSKISQDVKVTIKLIKYHLKITTEAYVRINSPEQSKEIHVLTN